MRQRNSRKIKRFTLHRSHPKGIREKHSHFYRSFWSNFKLGISFIGVLYSLVGTTTIFPIQIEIKNSQSTDNNQSDPIKRTLVKLSLVFFLSLRVEHFYRCGDVKQNEKNVWKHVEIVFHQLPPLHQSPVFNLRQENMKIREKNTITWTILNHMILPLKRTKNQLTN